MSLTCPVCKTEGITEVPNSPYHNCPSCHLWFQAPLPPKVFEADHEKDEHGNFKGHLMGDQEKDINNHLAKWLYKEPMRNVPGKCLDVGSKYPYLSHCLKNLGCNVWGMDGIEIVPEYSKELGVPMFMGNFEEMPTEEIIERTGGEKFRLITMVHMFEHLYDPKTALLRMRDLITPDGTVFLRLPDHGVSGYERDMTPGHFTIHPYFHTIESILELLVQTKNTFSMLWTNPVEGYGQRDILLRPINKAPTLYCGMIVKNEERDLPIALKSIEPIVDGIVIVDTGSTDKTLEVAKNTIKKPVWTIQYYGASKKDEQGDWKLWDFSKARNVFVDRIDNFPDADWLVWMDADDKLTNHAALKRYIYNDMVTILGVNIDGCGGAGPRWIHHRAWRTRKGIKFEGACHEYPTLGTHPGVNLTDVVIFHDAAPGIGEGSNPRNLRILEEEFRTHPNARTAFYLANTHNDAGRYDDAIKYYQERINFGEGYKDELGFAYLYKARCERSLKKPDHAAKTLHEATADFPGWAEFWMELAYISYDKQRWYESIGYCLVAASQENTSTQLWRENNKYSDQPIRIISWCYEHLNEQILALRFALKAKEFIQGEDPSWDERIAKLSTSDNSNYKGTIALIRPGAIGDVIMTLNLVPLLRIQNPDQRIVYFTHGFIANELRATMKQAGVDEVFDLAQTGVGENCKAINLIGYPLKDGYPEKKMEKHLLQYFAEEMGVVLKGNHIPSLQLPMPVVPEGLPSEDYATIQIKAGWSHYKEWDQDNWIKIIERFPQIKWVQIGSADDPKLQHPNVNHVLMGRPLNDSIAAMANARIHVGIDSFTNHLTNISWQYGDQARKVPAVILWGSTQPSAAGYPHNINIWKNLDCQPCFRENPKVSKMSRGPCVNPPGQVYDKPNHACMKLITVDEVALSIDKLWVASGQRREIDINPALSL